MSLRLIAIVLASVACSGCCFGPSAQDYRTPGTPYYDQLAINGLCDGCGQRFLVSGRQIDTYATVTCPYCKKEQGIKDSVNRSEALAQRENDQMFALLGLALASGQGAQTTPQLSFSSPDDHKCPTDNMDMIFTGKTVTESGRLLQLYRCPAGHEYWHPMGGNATSPYTDHPCPICGQGTWYTGENRQEWGKLYNLRRCPQGHISQW